jgi:hypothetical protein
MRKGANVDRTMRDLGEIEKTASTSRVLNLIGIGASVRNEPGYLEHPFFSSPRLNESLIIRHRVRSDEAGLLPDNRSTGTKVLLPFERTDLKIGGRSFLVGQRGWRDAVEDIGGAYRNPERDILVLLSLNELPSLDPFLVREQLKRRGLNIASCYFTISEADIARMQSFVGSQVEVLLDITQRNRFDGSSWSNRMIRSLLAPKPGDSIHPIRLALRLDPEDFEEGVFAWKGFLYHQWVLSELRPQLGPFLREILTMRTYGVRDRQLSRLLDGSRRRLVDRVNEVMEEVIGAIQVYEAAFSDLTRNGKPLAFANFLRKTPDMFILLGERIGALSHVASYWRFRFKEGSDEPILMDELFEIVRDFEYTLGGDN